MQRPHIPLSCFSTTCGISKVANFLPGKRMTWGNQISCDSAGPVDRAEERCPLGKSDTNSATASRHINKPRRLNFTAGQVPTAVAVTPAAGICL